MKHSEAIKQKLEPVYPEVHHLGLSIFYDAIEGSYYDSSTDLYLDIKDCRIPNNNRINYPNGIEIDYIGNVNGIGK